MCALRALAVLLLVGCGRLHFDDLHGACEPDDVRVAEVTSFDMTMGASEASVSLAIERPLERTILFTSVQQAEPSPTYGHMMCELTAAGVQCNRTMAGTDYAASTGEIRFRITLVTFAAGVRVQRGVTSPSASIAIDPVSLASSFVVLGGGWDNAGGSWGTNEYVRARLADSTTLELLTISTGQLFAWQVVTMAGASVQRGSRVMGTTELTFDAPLAPVEIARTLPLISNTADSTNTLGNVWSMVSAELTSTTNLRLTRSGDTGPVDVAWEVIALPFAVTSGVTTMPPGTTTVSESIAVSDRAVAVTSSQPLFGPSTGSVGSEDIGGVQDMVGEASVVLTTSPQSLVLTRGTALSTAILPWSVIDFAMPCPSGP